MLKLFLTPQSIICQKHNSVPTQKSDFNFNIRNCRTGGSYPSSPSPISTTSPSSGYGSLRRSTGDGRLTYSHGSTAYWKRTLFILDSWKEPDDPAISIPGHIQEEVRQTSKTQSCSLQNLMKKTHQFPFSSFTLFTSFIYFVKGPNLASILKKVDGT
jgi:hypothetical protein